MSSVYVRTQIKNFIAAAAPTETLVDLTAHFESLRDLLDANGVTDGPWVGIEFIGDNEMPRQLNADNVSGGYTETGAIYIHVVDVAKFGVADTILARGEVLRDLFRGKRIGEITIDNVTPLNFGDTGTLQFEDGYTAASFLAGFDRNFNL